MMLIAGWASPASSSVVDSPNDQRPEGFESLFTGRDLEGWDGGEVRSPEDFAKMSYQDWYNYRNAMSEGVQKHWQVKDGALVAKGNAPDLVSWDAYGDFEMWVDWKVTPHTDAGLGLRFGSQIKLWDADRDDETGGLSTGGSGGLWSNETRHRTPMKRMDKEAGQWNRMFVRLVGPYIKVRINGETVIDQAIFENPFNRDRPIEPRGPIHLQCFSGEIAFRNIVIREIPDEESNERLTEIAGQEDAFEPVFNGKDLSGWAGAMQGYEVVDGTLRCRRRDGGNIQTKKQYSNFVVRMEFKLPPGSNNGLLIRTPNTGPTHTRDTLEIQILDDSHIMHRQLGPSQYHGSAYGFAAAQRGYLRPVGQWNYQETYVKDDHIKVVLNGYPILDTKLKKIAPDHPAANTKRGHFGLSGYSDPVAFRKIRIQEIE